MSQFINFSQSGNNYYVSCNHSDFDTSDFYLDRGGYGQIKRVSINLIDLNTGNTYPFASSSFEILANKMDSKISKLIKDRIKGIGLEEAERLNEEAKSLNTFLENPLKYLSGQSKKYDLEYFMRKDSFEEREPHKPINESFKNPPKKPDKSIYKARVNFFHVLFGMKSKQITKSRDNYRQALKYWNNNTESYLTELKSHNAHQKKKEREYEKNLKDFQKRRGEFEAEKESFNSEVLSFRCLNNDSDERLIEKYFGLFLNSFSINNWFHIESAVFFENGTLIIDTDLPHSDDLPKIKSVSYIQSRQELKKTFISKSDEVKYYNNLIFSICLFLMKIAVVHNDKNLFLNVAVNGFIEGRSKSTGKMERKCIVSVLSDNETIHEIDFEHVDPKACFRSLKGLNGSKLVDEIPVQPIIQTSRADNRFVESVDQLDSIDSEFNLASMDWMEFEHLVREIFEKEFSKDGGEVKVTQSSRDGGVDAIAFDPDPIKGGKIVIQAKRYTNIVGVSNVRDLYGTVINEGANRGVLITTSDFGPDSHNFVKDKPISLLNGNNLLFLLQKYGYNAKIDIIEAKRILKDRGENI